MKYLLIYCHSNPKSFTHAVFEAIFNALTLRNVEVQVIDLYADHFNPVLLVDETHRRRDLHLDPETAVYRNRIEQADHLVFIYPVWWHGFPAMLKGFIDRVIASDFVYSFKDRPKGSLFPKGLMSDKKISCFYSQILRESNGWLNVKKLRRLCESFILSSKALNSFFSFPNFFGNSKASISEIVKFTEKKMKPMSMQIGKF